MTDILREVDEAMRAERMNRIWQQHGKSILFIVAGVIIGTAVHSGYSAYKNHQAREQTTALMDALHDPKTAGDTLAELTKTLKGSGKALAGLDAADQALSNKRYDEAIALYDVIASDKSVPADMRDLAVVQSVSIKLDHAPNAKPQELVDALAPIATSDKSVWKARALFVSAVIKANRMTNYKAALEDLALASVVPNLPSSFEVQIKALQDVYQLKASETTTSATAPSKE